MRIAREIARVFLYIVAAWCAAAVATLVGGIVLAGL